jgi:hypothetical protein
VTREAGTSPGEVGDVRVAGVDDGVTDGEAVADAGGAERAGALGPGALIAPALCPVRTTASAIAVPVTASAPAPKTAPDRKLVSSMWA